MSAVLLLPETDVRGGDGTWIAQTAEPWLAAPGLERLAGRWVAFHYAQGLLDEAVRPLARFRLGDGTERRVPLNGAPFGTARWIGRVPEGTVAVSFCPVRRPGPFAFTLLAARNVPRAALLARGLWRQPAMALTAMGARLIGARDEARHCLAFAASATPLADYKRWKRRNGRGLPPGIAAEQADGPTFHFLVRSGPADALARTRASLAEQSHRRWQAWVIDAEGNRPLASLGPSTDWITVLDAGDRLPPLALAQVAAAVARGPDAQAVVGDLEVAGAFYPQPDWSPLDGGTAGTFLRLAALPSNMTLRQAAGLSGLPDGLDPSRIATLHRPVRWCARAPTRPPPPSPALPDAPAVTVVVPFRDRPALLAACLAGLARTAGKLEIVLVDNGSTEPAAIRLATEAARAPHISRLHRPGPFNYAALCNAGAAAGTAPLLLFLNNDVEPREPDWLRRLAAQAARPGVGAVGARLLFPDGRLQHGGVVVGMGGTALHLGRGMRDRPDPLGLLDRPRRVGAVTGAVMMVERRKFDRVGGLDADAFPVLLNDIDLCLRLAARGWASFHEPRAVLTHRESASRGRAIRPLVAHAAERRRFIDRWGAAIRHDPAFHPALSLWSIPPALG